MVTINLLILLDLLGIRMKSFFEVVLLDTKITIDNANGSSMPP